MKKLIIYGNGNVAQAVSAYFSASSDYTVHGYTCDAEHISEPTFLGKPIIPFADCERHFPPAEYFFFVAVGYQGLNSLRAEKVAMAREKKYNLASYLDKNGAGSVGLRHGDNCLVINAHLLQPHVTIGDNVFIWNGVNIGHHCIVDNNCWLSPGVTIAGSVHIESNCFIGSGAVIGHELRVGPSSIIGAGTLTTKSLKEESVVVQADSPLHRLKSGHFVRFLDKTRV